MSNKTLHDQRLLSMLALYNAPIDGIEGNKTKAARAEFCENEDISYQDVSGLLIEKIKSLPELEYSNKEKLASVVKLLCKALYHDNVGVWSHIMATVEHETNGTFYPVIEAYYLSEEQRNRYFDNSKYAKKVKTKSGYIRYYGRGLVQLTWDYNYKKYQDILNAPLLDNPDIALEPATSLFILIHGTLSGTYTGRPISKYINDDKKDYINARRVVNGFADNEKSVAKKIAKLAEKWEAYYVSMERGSN